MSRPSILCPVDFSTPSIGALRYAAAIATHFGAGVTALTVNDPLLVEAASLHLGDEWLAESTHQQLQRFVADAFQGPMPPAAEIEVAVGKPAQEILRAAYERRCDLIVMSSRGLTGMRKLFFGATTERVLRETMTPVLITPPEEAGPADLNDVTRAVRRILAPIDLSPASHRQVSIAAGIARALDVPLLLSHVIEPLRYPAGLQHSLPNVDGERRDQSDKVLSELRAGLAGDVKSESITTLGDPAEEIANLAHTRGIGLVVVGLHGTPFLGPRMGSVTYRVLCLAPGLVLALPPAHAAKT